jgi:manganese-dependent inorganic pyrophosphatase
MYLESNIQIDKKIANYMIACILSDTLMFKSPTTTKYDIEIVKKLENIA